MLDTTGEKDERHLVWDFALRARMCTIYYQDQIRFWGRLDTGSKIASALMSSSAFVAILSNGPTWLNLGLTALAALISITHVALRVSDRVRQYGVLAAAYIAHYHRFASLFQFGWETPELRDAINSFHDTEVAEAKDEPTPSSDGIKKAQEQVRREIGESPAVA